jgi:hypothetical protein
VPRRMLWVNPTKLIRKAVSCNGPETRSGFYDK